MTRQQLINKGFECYDIARSKEQLKDMLKGVKTAFRSVKAINTTNEANKKEFHFTIYVKYNSIIIN